MTERVESQRLTNQYKSAVDLLSDKEIQLLDQANLLADYAKKEEIDQQNPLKMTIEQHFTAWMKAIGIFLQAFAIAIGSITNEPAETYTESFRRVGTKIIDTAGRRDVLPYLAFTIILISFLFIIIDYMETYVYA